VQMLQWFRLRWQVEVTFEEARAHLGMESQRQWSDLAIMRTTPALLALFSIVVTLAHQCQLEHGFDLPKAAWYHKELPTFVDALALVRKQLWKLQTFQMSQVETEWLISRISGNTQPVQSKSRLIPTHQRHFPYSGHPASST
jgi:hypothetical protein